ncbi:MAG: hypothetical protein KTR14_00820 [Vampirovibrio sp.]|nr:hypothetical protein [Vampirovibrio sp.]
MKNPTRRDRFNAYDTNAGNYSARKVPKWRYNLNEIQEYLEMLREDDRFKVEHTA